MKLKDPSEVRGKSKTGSIATPADVPEPAIVEGITEAPPENVSTINEIQAPDDLWEQNKKLEEEIEHKQYRINLLDKRLYESALEKKPLRNEILSKDARIRIFEKELSDVQREKEKYENSYFAYMHKLDKVRVALENNTPARAILEWMDQGDDE